MMLSGESRLSWHSNNNINFKFKEKCRQFIIKIHRDQVPYLYFIFPWHNSSLLSLVLMRAGCVECSVVSLPPKGRMLASQAHALWDQSSQKVPCCC